MAEHHGTPHFQNENGLARLRVRAREFMCVGALPPFDHPHIFIDMGADTDAVCPYCSTHFVYDATIAGLVDPPQCLFEPVAPAAGPGV
jgi:uncharacterized Zn-finger protein